MKYKKYIVLGFEDYNPLGGLDDIVISSDILYVAKEFVKSQKKSGHYQIVDRDTWEVVE